MIWYEFKKQKWNTNTVVQDGKPSAYTYLSLKQEKKYIYISYNHTAKRQRVPLLDQKI